MPIDEQAYLEPQHDWIRLDDYLVTAPVCLDAIVRHLDMRLGDALGSLMDVEHSPSKSLHTFARFHLLGMGSIIVGRGWTRFSRIENASDEQKRIIEKQVENAIWAAALCLRDEAKSGQIKIYGRSEGEMSPLRRIPWDLLNEILVNYAWRRNQASTRRGLKLITLYVQSVQLAANNVAAIATVAPRDETARLKQYIADHLPVFLSKETLRAALGYGPRSTKFDAHYTVAIAQLKSEIPIISDIYKVGRPRNRISART